MSNVTGRAIVLSVKPQYAELVFDGSKRIELRRSFSRDGTGYEIFVYVTCPVGKMAGGFETGKIWVEAPEVIWEKARGRACINETEFDAYYAGCEIAHALEIKGVWQYEHPVEVGRLREMCEDFVIPQSWRYLKPGEYEVLREIEGYKHAVN